MAISLSRPMGRKKQFCKQDCKTRRFDLCVSRWHLAQVRIMGLDVGSRTIGVALSDETGKVATGLSTIKRQGTNPDVRALQEIIQAHQVAVVVFGLPLEMSGQVGHRARRVLVLLDALAEAWPGSIERWDERLSTVAANRALLEADMSRRKRRKVVDQVAATLILQSYLDSRSCPTWTDE